MKTFFLNRLRYHAFWTLDAIKGGKVRKELKDIHHTFSLNSFESLQEKNMEKLHDLLNKVVEKSPLYKSFKGYNSLEDFPVVDKHIIKENFDQMQLVDPKETKGLHSMFTSGSTGTPFMVYQTQRKRDRNTADTIYFAGKAGYTIGDKLLYLRLWAKNLKKNKALAFLQNIEQLNVDDLNPEYIELLLDKLQKDKSPKAWLGYPSALEKICDYLDNIGSKPLDCNVKSIIGMSENLCAHVRSRMWYYFNTPMVSRYSNFENGIIAQQTEHGDYFEINWASYVLEILDFDSDEPVKTGELGRIVVTDLFNHATPMIRYDTGDIGAFSIKKGHKLPVLKTVEGRKTDLLLTTKGDVISPFKFMALIPKYPEIKQVQFIQSKKTSYVIKLNFEGAFVREDELVGEVSSLTGGNSEVIVEYVDEIPLLNSKKRKITRNLYTERSLQHV